MWALTGFGAVTACALDGGALVPCDSPQTYTGLSVGPHTLRVEVSSRAGSSSATHTWQVTGAGSSPPPPPSPPGSPRPPRPAPQPPSGGTQFAPVALAGHIFSPTRLRPGGRATLTLVLDGNARRITGEGRLTCSARAGKTRLRTVSRRLSATGTGATASCTWKLPERSRGRFLRALAEVSVGADDVERSVARRIR